MTNPPKGPCPRCGHYDDQGFVPFVELERRRDAAVAAFEKRKAELYKAANVQPAWRVWLDFFLRRNR